MTKLLKLLLGILLIGYLLFAILARVPAAWVVSSLQQAVPELKVAGVVGTAWKGRAGVVQYEHIDRAIALGELSWRLKPLSLLMLTPCVDLELSNSVQRFDGQACHGLLSKSTTLSDASFNGQLAELNGLTPIERMRGSLSVDLNKLKLESGKVTDLSGNLASQGFGFHDGRQWIQLGDFGGRLSSQNGDLTANISDINAVIGLNLTATRLAASGEPTASGDVTLKDSTPRLIREGIQTIGEELGENRYQISL